MINRRELARALVRSKVASWVVIERAQELALADQARSLERREKRTLTTMIVHHDQADGRGTARVDLAASDGDADTLVTQAIALADAALGPPWKSVPPAAPAKVVVFDRELDKVALEAAAAQIVTRIKRPDGATISPCATVMREQVAVESDSGFSARWTASHVHVDVLVSAHDRSIAIARDARRPGDLELDAAVETAVADLAELATATTAPPGPCTLVLRADAFLHGDDRGVWSVFVDQADAVLERQGLTRYRRGMPVVAGAEKLGLPLTIVSDGALDFATRSAPVGDHGDAVRRFALVERGIARGLGLSPKEAAVRKLDPNGGVRNLVVTPGTWDDTQDPGALAKRTIDVRRLRALSIDLYTGDASLELALAIQYANGKRTHAFTGGTIRLDLIAALAFAKRSEKELRRGAYLGPRSLVIENAELFA